MLCNPDSAIFHISGPFVSVVDPRQFKLVPMTDGMGKYYQIGADTGSSHMFLLSISIDSAANLLQVDLSFHWN
jgi:hypothetical protein